MSENQKNTANVDETEEVSTAPKGIFIPLTFRNAAVFAGASAIAASVATAVICHKVESDDSPAELETTDVNHDSAVSTALNE